MAITTRSRKKRSSASSPAPPPPTKKKGATSAPSSSGDAAPADEDDEDDPCLALLEDDDAHRLTRAAARSEALLAAEDYAGAVASATALISSLPPWPAVVRAALVRGRALLGQLKAIDDDAEDDADVRRKALGEAAWNAFGLAGRLDPEGDEAVEELEHVAQILGEIRPAAPPAAAAGGAAGGQAPDADVLIVGAGAAGVGAALMLLEFGVDKSRIVLVERGEAAGETFRLWPAEMRFISPSFNQQGWTDTFDLNAVAHGTSPAYSLHEEHPSGAQYAQYLAKLVETNELRVRARTDVTAVRPVAKAAEGGPPAFQVDVRAAGDGEGAATETLTARYVVWAAGEFQYPRAPSKEGDEAGEEGDLVGAALCLHNSRVRSWATLPGDDFVVIGGYESGIDAAVNLAKAGKRCRVLASTPCWETKTEDPSAELAPYTAGRLRQVMDPGFAPRPRLYAPLRAVRVEKAARGGFDVTAEWLAADDAEVHAPLRDLSNIVPAQKPGEAGGTLTLHTPQAPVLCAGFAGSVAAAGAARDLFAFADDDHPHKGCLGGAPLLTDDDESTKVPGVFLVGPQVQHDSLSFCFVYKFRQRFAVVANAICGGLGIDARAAAAECRAHNMYLDDLTKCEDTCGDVC